MREVTVRFVTDEGDKDFRVEVSWSPKSGVKSEDEYVDKIFGPCLDLMIKTVTPTPMGYGEGKTMEEARTKAFIERDIGRAGRSDTSELKETLSMLGCTPLPWTIDHQTDPTLGIDHLCIVNHETKQVVCSMSPWGSRSSRDLKNAGLIITAVTAAIEVLEKEESDAS